MVDARLKRTQLLGAMDWMEAQGRTEEALYLLARNAIANGCTSKRVM